MNFFRNPSLLRCATMRKATRHFLACVVSFITVTGYADTVQFRNGVDGYASQLDLSVYNHDTTDGTYWSGGVRIDGTLGIDGDAVGQSLVRFEDIIGSASGMILPGSSIESATLTLYTRRETSTNPGSVGRIQAYRMTTFWDTDSDWTTFDEWGGTDGVTLAGDFVSIRSSGVSNTNHAPNEIDITDALQAWADGAMNYGVGLMFDSGDAADLSSTSDEVQYRPLLSVSYTIPEPPSVLLVVMSLGVIALFTRWK